MSSTTDQDSKKNEWSRLFMNEQSVPDPNDKEAFERFLQERNKNRLPYFQVKEVWEREVMEFETVRKMVNFEIRDRCRIQIDDYMDCMAGKWLGWGCRPHRHRMENCLLKHFHTDYQERQETIRAQRRLDGTSLVNERNLSRHNAFVENVPEVAISHFQKSETEAANGNPTPNAQDGKLSDEHVSNGANYSRTEQEWRKEFLRVNKAPTEAQRMYEDVE